MHCAPNVIRVMKYRRMRWVGEVARVGEKCSSCIASVGICERMGPLGKSRRRGDVLKWTS